VDFGDNYQQSARDGINYVKRTVTLKWDCLTEEQGDAFEAFFPGKGGAIRRSCTRCGATPPGSGSVPITSADRRRDARGDRRS
jgi:phage-related protein